MFAANTYRIHLATDEDTDTLRALAERNSQQPLQGHVLIGEIDGAGAALSLSDGRVIADSSPRAGHLVANLRVRAASIWTEQATPSLRERLLAGLPTWYRAVSIATSGSSPETGDVEQESMLIHA